MKWIFFGTDEFATIVLKELHATGLTPSLIVCAPDMPLRRNKGFQAPATKIWAEHYGVPILQPRALDEEFVATLQKNTWDLFIVASYGKIISQQILDLPVKGTLNVHPSLLPKYRGASPVETAIIDDCKKTGVTIMEMDAKMDHGPIISIVPHTFTEWPSATQVRRELATIGGSELARIIPYWMKDEVSSVEQNHTEATFTKKFSKQDAQISLGDDAYVNLRKFQAFQDWNDIYFFITKNNAQMRVVIKEAHFSNNSFIIDKVVPEGKKEMTYQQFLSFIE
jgi:methionyl-tRNA formyltransferase